VILILTSDRTGLETWPLLVTKVAVSLLVAFALHHLVEQPLRHLDPPGRVVALAWLGASVAVAATALILL
jgi:peptidoglycan/LPS O-acetylase OafA/YrhL